MILSGKLLAEKVKKELIAKGSLNTELAIISIDADDVSRVYIAKKLEFAKSIGLQAKHYQAKDVDIGDLIDQLNMDSRVTGIILQLPIPENLDFPKILSNISPLKDVDGAHFVLGNSDFITYPPTILAIFELMKFYNTNLNKGVLIVGGGFLVGSPLKKFLNLNKIQAEILRKDDVAYSKKLAAADVCVVATGGGRTFHQSEFKQGATVIDATTVAQNNKLKGDVELGDAKDINIAPVPGGVGPVTVAMLFKNFFLLNKK